MCQYQVNIQQSNSNKNVFIEADNKNDAIERVRINYFDYSNSEYDLIRDANSNVVIFS